MNDDEAIVYLIVFGVLAGLIAIVGFLIWLGDSAAYSGGSDVNEWTQL